MSLDNNAIEEAWKIYDKIINHSRISDESSSEKDILKCINEGCDNTNFITDTAAGEIICEKCGFIQESGLVNDDVRFEEGKNGVVYCLYNPPPDPTNPYAHEMGYRGYFTSKQRAFWEGKCSFEIIQRNLKFTEKVMIYAKLFWGIILKSNVLKRGANRRGLKACCVYYAHITENDPVERDEISKAFYLEDQRDFTKGEKIFREIFEKSEEYSWILYKPGNIENMFSRYIGKIGLEQGKLRCSIVKVMCQIKKHCSSNLLGVTAKSEIAGISFFVFKHIYEFKKPNKSEVSKAVGVCIPTLNKVLNIITVFYKKNPSLRAELMQKNSKN